MPRRRTILLGSAALALSATFRPNRTRAAPPPVRYNVASTEGQAMLRIYAQGVALMKKLPATDPRSWTFQWYIHATPSAKAELINTVFGSESSSAKALATEIWYTCQAHQGQPSDYFLPWHRIYVMKLEEIIRALTGQPAFTLPYWDYTSPSSYSIPDAFQAKSQTDPLFSTLYQANRNKDDVVKRTADVNSGQPLNKYFQGTRNFLVLPDLTETNYGTFCNGLDRMLHGNVHVYTGDGTNMGWVPTAAGDPVFWLHHCNIDRIWMAWNAAGNSNPTQTQGTDWSNTTFIFVDGTGGRAAVAISSVSDSKSLPYSYDSLPRQAATQVKLASDGRAKDDLLMLSVTPEKAQANKPLTAQNAAAVALGTAPTTVALGKAATNKSLQLTAPLPGGRLTLKLKNLQAKADPGTTYEVYLALPPNAAPEVADEHYVGLLNFFGVVMQMPPGHTAMPGPTIEFDVTQIVRRLSDAHALPDDISVTLVPVGQPQVGANAVITGGIELHQR